MRHLITELPDRGLDASEGVLFVLEDGALKTVVTDGKHAVIAHCRLRHSPRRHRLAVEDVTSTIPVELMIEIVHAHAHNV